jgi:twitching motility protein PilT
MIQVTPETIGPILDDLTRAGASDIQLKTGQPPLIALHGAWQPQGQYEPLNGQAVDAIHKKLCRDGRYTDIPKTAPWDADYRTATKESNFRVSGGKEHGRPFLVLRPLPREIPDFGQLRLLDDELGEAPAGFGFLTSGFEYVLRQKRGLVLVTGPTGSGKSTTLASFVNHINRTQRHNIITIEDPIEFVFRAQKSQILQREVGVDTDSFSTALRQKPDVILVGEMRDTETINAAFRAAATGHLVLSTLHNNEAAATVERIINEFPPAEQNRARHALSEVLVGIFAQQLVPTVDGQRQVIHEAMVLTPSMRTTIRPKDGEGGGAYLQALRDLLRQRNDLGTRAMDAELRRAAQAGIISEEAALEYAIQPDKWTPLAQGQGA